MLKILIFLALMLSIACGGGSEPDGESIPANALLKSEKSGSAAVVPTIASTPVPAPTIKSQPKPKSSPVKKSIELDSNPKISCVLNKGENQIACTSTNIKEGSQLKWTSTATDAHMGGSSWQFTINKQPVENIEKVFVDICQGSTCQRLETSIDTSELVSADVSGGDLVKGVSVSPVVTQKNITPEPTAPTQTPIPTQTPSPPPVLNLPFTTDEEPVGMMPMGETILHPATTDNPNGHPGIDFQWPFKAKVIAATNGEVLEIRISAMHSAAQDSEMYYVSVMSGDFVVTYDVLDLYSFNPDLDVGSKIMSGQVIGYPNPTGSGDGWTSIHWAFGKWLPGSEKPNPEGIVEKFRVDYMCPVPYFSEAEKLRLFRLWDAAKYPNAGGFEGEELKKQFPDVCNGPYKNY